MKEIAKHTTVLSAVGFMLLLTASDCKTVNNDGKVTPQPPVITDSSDCEAACTNLQRLHCPEGEPIDMGDSCKASGDCKDLNNKSDPKQYCGTNGHCMVTCATFCVDTQNQGVWLDPACVKQITSCEQINSCPTPKKPGPTCEGPACPPDIRTK